MLPCSHHAFILIQTRGKFWCDCSLSDALLMQRYPSKVWFLCVAVQISVHHNLLVTYRSIFLHEIGGIPWLTRCLLQCCLHICQMFILIVECVWQSDLLVLWIHAVLIIIMLWQLKWFGLYLCLESFRQVSLYLFLVCDRSTSDRLY